MKDGDELGMIINAFITNFFSSVANIGILYDICKEKPDYLRGESLIIAIRAGYWSSQYGNRCPECSSSAG